MLTWKRSIAITSWPVGEVDETSDLQVDALKERLIRFCGGLAKGVLAAVLYGSGSLVLSGVLFYFSWKLGIAALLVLGGLFPLAGSGYMLWRLMRRGRATVALAPTMAAGGHPQVGKAPGRAVDGGRRRPWHGPLPAGGRGYIKRIGPSTVRRSAGFAFRRLGVSLLSSSHRRQEPCRAGDVSISQEGCEIATTAAGNWTRIDGACPWLR